MALVHVLTIDQHQQHPDGIERERCKNGAM